MAEGLRTRKSFGKSSEILAIPNLLEIQIHSFERFLQENVKPGKREDVGLQAAFSSVFPIVDYNETASIEFLEYIMGQPKYDLRESLDKGINYASPLKIKVKLNLWEKGEGDQKRLKESREQEVYLGELPLMTDTGTFVINGVERVVVSQLHRSPGILFSHDKAKSVGGQIIFSARIIPARGSWFDFEFDTKDTLYVRIDRRKKLHATIILKALGFSEEQILRTYYPIEEIKIKRGTATRGVSEILAGLRAFKSINHPKTDEVFVKEGGRITKAAVKKLDAAKIKEIPFYKEELVGRVTLTDIIDPDTGEIILESNEEITEELAEEIMAMKLPSLQLIFIDGIRYLPSLRNTLRLDKVGSTDEALVEIYKKLRPGEPPSIADARSLFEGLFFEPKRYDLSIVGRLKLNKRLGLDVPLETRVLTDRDIVEILRYLFDLRAGWRTPGKPVQDRAGQNGARNKREDDIDRAGHGNAA
jgi:DNA-directed RNA polymerase subunit beta